MTTAKTGNRITAKQSFREAERGGFPATPHTKTSMQILSSIVSRSAFFYMEE